jgi:immune inhibitor A
MRRTTSAIRIAVLLAFALAAACDGGSGAPSPTPAPDPPPQPTATPTAAPSPTPQSTDEPPDADLIDLARRFRGLPADAPRDVRQEPLPRAVGDTQEFSVLELNGPSVRKARTTLRLITDHAYFWVEDGLSASQPTLERLGADFESIVYPRVTSAFGDIASPGVDADPRISIVHADLAGAGGYVSSVDGYSRAVAPRSNESEAIYLDAYVLGTPGAPYNALLAHELQHLVHAAADDGEEAWVDEGLAQVAAELAGGGTGQIGAFLRAPDSQLNDWLPSGGVHYGESQLFFRYLLDRFGGRDNAADFLAVPEDGIEGVEAYLEAYDTTFDDVFADWLVANYLDDGSERFGHQGADLRTSIATDIGGYGDGEGTVHQFAADYLEVSAPGGGALTIDGADEVGIGIEPQDGAFWWSNTADGIDSRLTRAFDVSGLDSATLRFRLWYDLELGWDYAYVAASRDGGATWEALPGRHTTDYDPVLQAYGPGYTGDSGGAWMDEEIDLTPYAGGQVLLRFEYVTDAATHGRGFAIDDIQVPELGFADDAGAGGDWLREGFHRVEGPLAQRFLVRLIEPGDPASVREVDVSEGNVAQLLLGPEPVTVVVAAVTRGTREEAAYTWSLAP